MFSLFIFGLIIGSFLNVSVYLLEKKKRKNLGGRSFCPSCKHELGFWDLIPLFSWIFLQGKCRYCKKEISYQYPLVELGTGIIFFLSYYLFFNQIPLSDLYTFSISSILALLSVPIILLINSLLIIIFVYDLKHKIIPDKIIYPAIILTITYLLLVLGESFLGNSIGLIPNLYPFLAAFGAGGFFYSIAAVSDGKWMGGGDIKLAFLMGLILGWPNILVGLFLGFFLGAIVGVSLILVNKKKLSSEIPFGPFLITGTWIALFWGEMVVSWYLRVLGL